MSKRMLLSQLTPQSRFIDNDFTSLLSSQTPSDIEPVNHVSAEISTANTRQMKWTNLHLKKPQHTKPIQASVGRPGRGAKDCFVCSRLSGRVAAARCHPLAHWLSVRLVHHLAGSLNCAAPHRAPCARRGYHFAVRSERPFFVFYFWISRDAFFICSNAKANDKIYWPLGHKECHELWCLERRIPRNANDRVKVERCAMLLSSSIGKCFVMKYER